MQTHMMVHTNVTQDKNNFTTQNKRKELNQATKSLTPKLPRIRSKHTKQN